MTPGETTAAAIAAIDAIPATAERTSERAAACAPAADALRRILEGADIVAIDVAQEAEGIVAASKQPRYKWPARVAAILAFLAAALAGAALYATQGGNTSPDSGIAMRHAFVIGQAACALFATVIWVWLWLTGPHEKWLRSRAIAEQRRLQHFDAVFRSRESATQDELPVMPLKIEYMRRYLMEDQAAWYARRAKRYRRENACYNVVRVIAGILAASLAIPFLARMGGMPWLDGVFRFLGLFEWWSVALQREAMFALNGLIGTSAFTMLATFAAISMSVRNASRYQGMHDYLANMSEQPLRDARLEAAACTAEGNTAAYDFWRLIHDELDVEHREWHGTASVQAAQSLQDLRDLKLPRL